MKLVSESLDQLYREKYGVSPYIYMELLNEGIQFSSPRDAIQKATRILPHLTKNKRLNLLALLFLLNAGTVGSEVKKEDVKNDKVIQNLADDPGLTAEEIFNAFDLMHPPEEYEPKIDILKVTPEFISDLDTVKPGRFSEKKIEHYNKFDKEIMKAVNDLRAKGEDPNPDLIKAIMLIETGMNPTKNKWGFEGFPQTKEHIIKGWTDEKGNFHPGINQRYGTNFTIKDMYDPYKAAQFIHYYLDAIGKSKWVSDSSDLAIAYNWGTGNLAKYKKGEKELPKQPKDYARMIDAMKKHFSGT